MVVGAICPAACVLAANFEGAMDAYRLGDFAGALANGLERLAQDGDATSEYYLGLMHANGQGVAKDETKAAQWYEKSAVQGYAKAQNRLGDAYYHGRGVAVDYPKARDWYRKAAVQGLAIAQRNLGESYRAILPQDSEMTVFWLKKAAAQGDDMDQFAMAWVYSRWGMSGVQDPKKSAFWMRKAANQGVAAAQLHLGGYYRSGAGVPRDYAKAIYWLKRAARQGHGEAAYQIGQMHEHGKGMPADPVTGMQWYCRAAKLGHGNGIFALANGGRFGFDCLTAVATQGLAAAQWQLGLSYENEIGDSHDYRSAASWYRKAAEQGDGSAMNELADLYALGHGVGQDPVLAQMLYNLAMPRTSGTQHSSRINRPLSESEERAAMILADAWTEGTALPENSEGALPPK